MKYSVIAAVFAAVVAAQSIDEIPQCAQACLATSVSKVTSCSATDFKCICEEDNFTKVQGDATTCVIKACGAEVATGKVLPATQKLCQEAKAGGSSSSSMPASMSMPASSSMSMAASSEPATTSMAAGTSTMTMDMTTTECPTTMAAATQPAGNNGTAPMSSSVPVAGAAAVGSMGALAMFALGALAL